MAIKDIVKRLVGFRLGGSYLSEMAIPPGLNYERYLQIYGEVGWLYGAVSLIASSVAQVEWKLYQKKANKELALIEDHPLIDLIDSVNPFQTRYQFMLLMQTYLCLVGEAFIILDFNKLRVPAQMWLAPPACMSIVPSSTNYISHYEFRRGATKLRLEVPEVIHIMDTNPANPYRGLGAAKAAGIDIDAEYYAARYQQRLFFNDAMPGLIMEFPDTPSAEDRKLIREEFNATHQGWRNARKPAFLFGGAKANTITLSNRDMDFKELRNASKKLILGAYHIPDSLIGAGEIGSRARAEADEYIFGKYTIKPALVRIREALNEQLCPLFDESLQLDFPDPVPADETTIHTNNREDFKAGIITREEARQAIGLEAEAESGETYLLPVMLVPEIAKQFATRTIKTSWTEQQKEVYWHGYIARTESQERMFIRATRGLFDNQLDEVSKRLDDHQVTPDKPFAETEAIDNFTKVFTPLITKVYETAVIDNLNDFGKSVKQDIFLSQVALEWIATRSLSLAKMINGTTKDDLRKVLAESFELGESIAQTKKRLIEYYGKANKYRAEMVARTEVITANNKGAEDAYKRLGVEKVEWFVALDERTCDECMALHENIYGINEGPRPALHPNCRCTILPMVE